MPRSLRLAYFAHSLRSDWNNGNAHFLRGLMRSLGEIGHSVTVFEPCTEWSIQHLREEKPGERALERFFEIYPDLTISTYTSANLHDPSFWKFALKDCQLAILHEWNPPALAAMLLQLKSEMGFRLLFHDTHHRACSSPGQIQSLGIDRFDGVLVFGEVLRRIYQSRFGTARAWTLHEAADVTVFSPDPGAPKTSDVVWIGNWGDDERSAEIKEFLLGPAAARADRNFLVHGVRYPEVALAALQGSGVKYGGYIANLDAPALYAGARLTVHIPRRQYATILPGIPTIRVFEALACGIPLISAPWNDTEGLFREGDFLMVGNGDEMRDAMEMLLSNSGAAAAQAQRGLETILSRHTCRHRAEQLTCICEELVQ